MVAASARSTATLAATHPCYTESASLQYGRIHLPVASRCNLGCTFCERTVGPKATSIGGPGSAERILSPQEAAAKVNAIKSLGWLHVVGIAGPAEPLASSEAFETLRLIHAAHPELVLCLSTNGLNLERGLPGLIALGLRALTVTINAADADVASRLYAWAELDGERVPGGEAANEILRRQWRGLEQAARTGLLVKVNSVFVPGLNDRNLAAVARRAAALGAHRQNIMSLIPRGRMRDRRPPSRRELAAVQRECEQHIPQFRGCTQCPADVIEPPLSLGAGDRQCVCTRPTEKICTLTAT